jgi:hypothetical protein
MIACQQGWERGWVSRDHGVCYCAEPLRSRATPMRDTVLTDDDVRRVMPMSAAVDRIESAARTPHTARPLPARCERRSTCTLPPFYQPKRRSRMPMWSCAPPRAPRPCSIPAGSNPAPTSTPSGPGPRARVKWTPASRGESSSSPQTRSANSGVMPNRLSWPIPPDGSHG